jgi:hypothetical protein
VYARRDIAGVEAMLAMMRINDRITTCPRCGGLVVWRPEGKAAVGCAGVVVLLLGGAALASLTLPTLGCRDDRTGGAKPDCRQELTITLTRGALLCQTPNAGVRLQDSPDYPRYRAERVFVFGRSFLPTKTFELASGAAPQSCQRVALEAWPPSQARMISVVVSDFPGYGIPLAIDASKVHASGLLDGSYFAFDGGKYPTPNGMVRIVAVYEVRRCDGVGGDGDPGRARM